MRIRDGLDLFRQAGKDFLRDDAMTLGAALAYYTALSMAPLLVLLVWILSLLGWTDQRALIDKVNSVVGPQAGASISEILSSAKQEPNVGTFAGIGSFVLLLLSASGVFGQLQHALNLIWNVEPKPGRGIKGWIRNRILSLGMVVTIGFLLVVSLAASAFLSALTDGVDGEKALWLRIVDVVLPIVVYAILFAAVFRMLPDVRIQWRDVAVGGIATALLFTIGKTLIGLYLGKSSTASAYGAAGSLVVLLLWVYYSSLIVFFGAELTQAWSRLFGGGIQPAPHAQRRQEAVGTDKPAKVNPSTA